MILFARFQQKAIYKITILIYETPQKMLSFKCTFINMSLILIYINLKYESHELIRKMYALFLLQFGIAGMQSLRSEIFRSKKTRRSKNNNNEPINDNDFS